ncbi:MAG: hypothetical protein AAFY52_10700 [Pseudomonadota bacterium]
MIRVFCAFAVAVWVGGVSAADTLYRVELRSVAGDSIEIAQLSTHADGKYTITPNAGAYTDHFLSMRPFKCLEGPDKHWCHVPYPYEIARDISGDLVDLEYDFLFLWKASTDYGIDTWNGIYYVLARDGDGMIGQAHEIDLGTLAVPPAAGELRPIAAKDLHETDLGSHWLPYLHIVPVR